MAIAFHALVNDAFPAYLYYLMHNGKRMLRCKCNLKCNFVAKGKSWPQLNENEQFQGNECD